MLGIGISAVGLPKATAAFSAADMAHLAVQPAGVAYLSSMLALIAGLSVFVHKFERDYPLLPATVAAAAATPPAASGPRGGAEGIPARRLFLAHVAFPTVLSSYETIAQLCIKGGTSMMCEPHPLPHHHNLVFRDISDSLRLQAGFDDGRGQPDG